MLAISPPCLLPPYILRSAGLLDVKTYKPLTGDGFKDIPADRMGPRMRCRQSIDEIREIAREIVRCGGLDGQWLGQVQAYEQTVLGERV